MDRIFDDARFVDAGFVYWCIDVNIDVKLDYILMFIYINYIYIDVY